VQKLWSTRISCGHFEKTRPYPAIDAVTLMVSNHPTSMPLLHTRATLSVPAQQHLIRPFMPELDMLRGIAVLAVLFFHGFFWRYGSGPFAPWPARFMSLTRYGWTGVNLFFVLSGCLITCILLDSKAKPHYYRRFYIRRALRILPAYYALLFVLLIFRSASPAFVGLSAIYLANVTDFFGVPCDYGPLWSLAVEEHFYILWPTFVRKLTGRHLALASALIILVTPILRAFAFATGHGGIEWYTWFVADGLAAGSLLAVVLRTNICRAQVWRVSALLIVFSVCVAAIGAPFGIVTRARLLGAALQYSVVTLMGSGIILLVLLVGTSAARRWVTFRLLRFLGYLSYGLYLDHLLAFRLYDRFCLRFFPQLVPSSGNFPLICLRFALAVLAAVGVAFLSRKYFEERFLRLKDSLAPQMPASEEESARYPQPQTKLA
jgi:peptidoglycan/LPS O-acetylase OafA/YrhL